MKIVQNPSFIQQNIQTTKVQKTATKSTTTNITPADNNVTVSISTNNRQSLKSINTLQKDFAQTQQLFGSLTQLTDAIKLFKQAPNAYQENIKKIITEIQKDFPQFNKNINAPQEMMVQATKVKNELSTKMASQKKAITHYLISAQNKDAVQKKSITTADTQKIAQQVSNNSVTPLHNPRITQITQLLNP